MPPTEQNSQGGALSGSTAPNRVLAIPNAHDVFYVTLAPEEGQHLVIDERYGWVTSDVTSFALAGGPFERSTDPADYALAFSSPNLVEIASGSAMSKVAVRMRLHDSPPPLDTDATERWDNTREVSTHFAETPQLGGLGESAVLEGPVAESLQDLPLDPARYHVRVSVRGTTAAAARTAAGHYDSPAGDPDPSTLTEQFLIDIWESDGDDFTN